MASAIIFKITNAGRQALDSGAVSLSYVALGTTRHAATGDETALQGEVVRTNIISGGVEPLSSVLRFSADVVVDNNLSMFEVGVFTDTGILFALASSNSVPFFTISPAVNFAVSFGMLLDENDAPNVSVISDDTKNKALTVMESHLAESDPHRLLLDVVRFRLLLDTAIPIGYLYHSHSDVNPKPLFDELLGEDTEWRRVTGRIIVATDDDKFIESERFKLGQCGMTTAAIDQRPNVYPLQTTHIWERVDPNEFRYDGKHNYDGNANYQ